MTRTTIEYTVAGALAIVFVAALLNAVVHARVLVRDDLRREDMSNLKRALELYNNTHSHYGVLPKGAPACTSADDPDSWLFGDSSPLLKEQYIDAIPHDVREGRGHVYRFCSTALDPTTQTVTGYFVEAQLEADQDDMRAFDEDEDRKFHYRTLHEDGAPLYRVCGGTETQCMPQNTE